MVVGGHSGPDDLGQSLTSILAIGVDDDPPILPFDVPQADLVVGYTLLCEDDLFSGPRNEAFLRFGLPDVDFVRGRRVTADHESP